jgi:hypothetical protein
MKRLTAIVTILALALSTTLVGSPKAAVGVVEAQAAGLLVVRAAVLAGPQPAVPQAQRVLWALKAVQEHPQRRAPLRMDQTMRVDQYLAFPPRPPQT